MRVRAERKRIAFQTDLSNDLPGRVHGDERRLRQVLLNLLGNAVKFTEQGSVTLRVKPLHSPPPLKGGFSIATDKDSPLEGGRGVLSSFRFKIEDTGPGIPPEYLQTIFEPFRQIGEKRQKTRGTGLGLAISRNLVDLMGGRLQVTSQPGAGSTFWFEIPLSEVHVETERSLTPERQIIGVKGTPPTILVVDDNWENRSVLVNLLAPTGCTVLEAANGREGLAKVLESPPDAIMTDLIMPEMDGFELIRQIRQNPALQKVVVIAASASVYEEDQQRSLSLGSDAFLPKPVEATRLFDLLAQLLHVEWVYQEAEEREEDLAKLILPPRETLEFLLMAARQGNLAELQHRLTDLVQSQPQYQIFVSRLEKLARQFKLNDIERILKEYLS
jgi:CheY-like chemotaxis protein